MYNETPIEGPEAKMASFSVVQEALKVQISSATYHAIQSAFPNAQNKRLSKEHNPFVVGVHESLSRQTTDALDVPEMQEPTGYCEGKESREMSFRNAR